MRSMCPRSAAVRADGRLRSVPAGRGVHSHTRPGDGGGSGTREIAGVLIGVVGLMSALLANDIVCLAVRHLLAMRVRGGGLIPGRFCSGWPAPPTFGSAAT